MKFLLSLAIFAAAGVSAQSATTDASSSKSTSECEADYIVTRCLETETVKVRSPRKIPSANTTSLLSSRI